MNDGYGASFGLTNKQIVIRPNEQPAFTIVIFHCGLVSSAIQTGKRVATGELLGYARMYYEYLGEYSTSFDIAVWANTLEGVQLISYFDAINDEVFNIYSSRGIQSRLGFIITVEELDADPLECLCESFVSAGNLKN